MQATLTLTDVLWILGAITAIITFINLVNKPYKDLEEKVNTQAQTVKDLSNDIKAQQKLLNNSLKAQLLLMQHLVYGNHTDSMKQELTRLQSIIVDINS